MHLQGGSGRAKGWWCFREGACQDSTMGLGCERVDVRWRSSQNKANVNGGPCEPGGRLWARGGHYGHYEDNRERVQRHDPDRQPAHGQFRERRNNL